MPLSLLDQRCDTGREVRGIGVKGTYILAMF